MWKRFKHLIKKNWKESAFVCYPLLGVTWATAVSVSSIQHHPLDAGGGAITKPHRNFTYRWQHVVEVSYQLWKCDHLTQMSSPEKIYKPLIETSAPEWNSLSLSQSFSLSVSPILSPKSSLCCNKTLTEAQKYTHDHVCIHANVYALPQPSSKQNVGV